MGYIKGRRDVVFIWGAICIVVCSIGSCVWNSPTKGGQIKVANPLLTRSSPSPGSTLAPRSSVSSVSSSDTNLYDNEEGVEEPVYEKAEDAEKRLVSIEWRRSYGDQCYKSARYEGFCQGPRRVPKPFGAAAALAKELGLDALKAMYQLLMKPPESSWVTAAGPNTDPNKLLWPIPGGKLLRGYGMVGQGKNRHLHKGIDIAAEEGAFFYAVASGIVAFSDNKIRGYGNLLAVIHPNRSVALYSHARALYLFAGQKVRRGQVLGEVGHTGFAQRSHLHFEYRVKGRPTRLRGKFENY